MKGAPKRFSWEELNAYVDGEADLRLAAEIAAAAAGDRAVADAIAMLAGLKAASAEALAVDPPAAIRPIRMRPRRFLRAVQAMAAILVAAIAVAAVLFLMPLATGDRPTPEAEALAMHEAWLAADASEGRIDAVAWPGDGLAKIEVGGRTAAVPDLAFARMRIGHLAVEPAGEGSGLFVGYVGRNNCRLGLWIAPTLDAGPPTPGIAEAEGRRIATWQASGLSYAAVAEDMDPARFMAIIRHLQAVTRPAADPAEGTLMASRPPIANEPCVS